MTGPGAPTATWPCPVCGATVVRYRGQADVACRCGAEFNAGGQRLRDGWRDNPSVYDDEITDLDGYEIAALRRDTDAETDPPPGR